MTELGSKRSSCSSRSIPLLSPPQRRGEETEPARDLIRGGGWNDLNYLNEWNSDEMKNGRE
jgi:hypothetical protein